MKQFKAIILVPVAVDIYANDIQAAEESAKRERDSHESVRRPDGELAPPYILSIQEVYANDFDLGDPEPTTELLAVDDARRTQPYFDPWFDGPRAA